MSEAENDNYHALQYAEFTNDQLKQEYMDIISIPNARTNINALKRMSALITEFENRGIPMPGKTSNSTSSQNYGAGRQAETKSEFNVVSFIIGIILVIGGISMSMNTGSVFYGAVLVGIVMVFKSFI